MAREQGTRERILDVALDLFVEEGYDKASLREIAEHLGMTKAALYYHFPSKADILMALHYRLHALMDGPLELLGEGTVSVATLEAFLYACIDKLQDAEKLILLHRNSASALSEVHDKDHAGSHVELEERMRKLFSDPALPPAERIRMAAASAAAFATPLAAGPLLGLETGPATSAVLRSIVRAILHAPADEGESDRPGVARRHRRAAKGPAGRPQ